MAFAYEGTVSHGTMLEGDLIPAFLAVLADLNPGRAKDLEARYPEAIADPESEAGSELTELLFDALNDAAPEGYYFGAHPGDGADYGFWVLDDEDSWEQIRREANS